MIRITRRIPRDVHANRSRTILGEINNGLRQLSSYLPGTLGNFARTWFVPDVRLGSIVLSLLALLVTGVAQGAQPQIFYSDIESGPNSGGEGSAGAFVTLYGTGFGSPQGSSFVKIGTGRAANYRIWIDTRIALQINGEDR